MYTRDVLLRLLPHFPNLAFYFGFDRKVKYWQIDNGAWQVLTYCHIYIAIIICFSCNYFWHNKYSFDWTSSECKDRAVKRERDDMFYFLVNECSQTENRSKTFNKGPKKSLRRGIEPRSPAWQAGIMTIILSKNEAQVGYAKIHWNWNF